jgi:alpha-1,6-mannosyltransferase
MLALCWAQAYTLWDGEVAPRAHAFFEKLVTAAPWLPVTGLFDNNGSAVLSHMVPLAVMTAATLAAWVVLQRHADTADADRVRQIRAWAFAFAAVSLPMFPVFTQDFWLSAAWGRMIAEGHNPYHIDLIEGAAEGLPLDHFAMRMPYGPLWAMASAVVMACTGGHVLLTALVFKLIIAAAWLGALRLVELIAAPDGAARQCTALLLVGWLPAGVSQAIAEGHNDIVMVALMLLWWWLMRQRGGLLTPLALAGSALCKYVSLSLFAVDAIHALRAERLSLLRYALRMVLPALLIVVVVGTFFRSLEYFDGLRMISSWGFLHLHDSAEALGKLTGLRWRPLAWLAQAVFAGTALWCLLAAWRAPTPQHMGRAILAVLSFMIFALSPHLWPWYAIWVLPAAVLAPGWWLSRFAVGMAIALPFVVPFWWIDNIEDHKDIAALLMHGAAVIWMLAGPRLERAR